VISFAELHERLECCGIAVGVEQAGRGHAITLVDPDSLRSIRFPVRGAGFDRAAAALVASARLREQLGTGAIRYGGVRVEGRWPELAELAAA
jgi:hypothetical protein